jgi:hypothetical protein
MRISVSGTRFEVDSHGFGAHDASATAAIRRLEELLTPYGSQQLNDTALLEQLAQQAAHQETATWRCWQSGYHGDLPTLAIRRTDS